MYQIADMMNIECCDISPTNLTNDYFQKIAIKMTKNDIVLSIIKYFTDSNTRTSPMPLTSKEIKLWKMVHEYNFDT